jgi:hypothetical protein
VQDLTLNAAQRALVAELAEGPVLDAVIDAARWRAFKQFEKADPMERMQIGSTLDALKAVRSELQTVINEAAVSGRIPRIS